MADVVKRLLLSHFTPDAQVMQAFVTYSCHSARK